MRSRSLSLFGLAVGLAALALGCGSTSDKHAEEDMGVEDATDSASQDGRLPDEVPEQTGDDLAVDDSVPDQKPPADVADVADMADDVAQEDAADLEETAQPLPAEITVHPFTHWQRGPVSVVFDVAIPSGKGTVAVHWFATGSNEAPATSLEGFGDGTGPFASGTYRFVWDSMADVQEDLDVHVVAQLTPEDGSLGPAMSETVVHLRNAPDRNRAALLTNGINGASIVRAPVYDFQAGFSLTAADMTSGKSPKLVTFHPGGISAVTCDQDDNQLSFYAVSEDAVVSQALVLQTPDRYFDDIEWSDDGTTLYLLDFNPTADAGVYTLALDTDTGLPQAGAAPKLLSHHWAGNEMDLLPQNQGYVVTEGNEADPGSAILLSVMDKEGTMVGQHKILSDGSSPSVLEVTPDGSQALLGYYNLFGEGDKVLLFLIHPDDNPELMGEVSVYDPYDVDFTEDGTKALLAESQDNKVTVLVLGGGMALSKGSSLTMGLPSDVFSMHWGSQADLFMVTTVSGTTGISSVAMVNINGTSPVKAGAWDLGDGIEHLIDSAGMQQ